jgi:hypothetical protein
MKSGRVEDGFFVDKESLKNNRIPFVDSHVFILASSRADKKSALVALGRLSRNFFQ